MRVTLTESAYTQINSNEAEFLIQNLASSAVNVVVNPTQPLVSVKPDFVLQPGEAISSNLVTGKVWIKGEGEVGYV